MLSFAKNKSFSYVSVLNLLVIFFTIFICPVFPPKYLEILYPVCFMTIFILVSLILENGRTFNLMTALIISLMLMSGLATGYSAFINITRILEFVFFLSLLVRMVFVIANTKSVSKQVIIDAVTGYFLLGLAFSTMVALVSTVYPGAYNVRYPDITIVKFIPLREYLYFSFITYTTTGYGDIVPTIPISKSLAILTGVSGQLYIAIIIAMLVGKYSNKSDT